MRVLRLAAAVLLLALPQVTRAVAQAPFMVEPGQSYTMPVRTIKELKRERAFRTTIHQQYDFSCGSAAVATLLTFHYNRRVDEGTVFRAMFAAGDQAKIRAQGFSLLDMKRYLEANGFQADGVQVPLDELARVGVPAIALLNDNGYRHFVVVKGVHNDRVILGDPAVGTRILDRRQFESLRMGGIFFVIRSHLDTARFNMPADWQTRLVAPIDLSVVRDSLGTFTLTLPDGNRF